MTSALALRRHLYEEAARSRGRRRRTLRTQARLLGRAQPEPGAGGAGVREPRSPHPPVRPAGQARRA